MPDIITDAIRQILSTRHALIESACETAITGGKHGVLVIESPNLFAPEYFHVEINESVPYGHLFSFPSREALGAWIENGMPL
jgi:hypothetical protein